MAQIRPGSQGRGPGRIGIDSISSEIESTRRSTDHDLIGQERMTIGQVEYCLLGQLLGMVGTRSALEDDHVVGADDVEIANPSPGLLLNVARKPLGKVRRVLDPSQSERVVLAHRLSFLDHAGLPGGRRGRETHPKILVAERVDLGGHLIATAASTAILENSGRFVVIGESAVFLASRRWMSA
jgi:hypothetical protein